MQSIAIHTIDDYNREINKYAYYNSSDFIKYTKNVEIAEYIWSLSDPSPNIWFIADAITHDAPIEVIKFLMSKGCKIFPDYVTGGDGVNAYIQATKRNRFDLIKLFHEQYPTEMSRMIIERDQLATEVIELKKDMEMYKSFYDHYHGWSQL